MKAKPDARPEAKFSLALIEALRDEGSDKLLTPRAKLMIRDLMETTEAADVEEAFVLALGEQIGAAPRINLKKRSSRCCILAFVEMDIAPAAELQKATRLKVGGVRCRVTTYKTETRYYRYHTVGHVDGDCTNVDCCHCCRRCKLKGHKAAEYQNSVTPRLQ